MAEQNQSLADLQHIKKMMERSGRFISLSGLSGVAAGICALGGAWFAYQNIHSWGAGNCLFNDFSSEPCLIKMDVLLLVAAITFTAAFISAFIFTYLRSKKNNVSLWGQATVRLFWNTAIPLAAGSIFIYRMLEAGMFGFIAPGCLIFYGLALVNASKYTLGEIRYLGYCEIILGIINLWNIGYGLEFWGIGFGILHIVYGIAMWWKYERKTAESI